MYLCFRIRNRNGEPYEVGKLTLMHKTRKDSVVMEPIPILYKKGVTTISGRDEQSVVYVTDARVIKKNDEIITIIYNGVDKSQTVLYTPAAAFPKYMITK